jgi:hypothetical protein
VTFNVAEPPTHTVLVDAVAESDVGAGLTVIVTDADVEQPAFVPVVLSNADTVYVVLAEGETETDEPVPAPPFQVYV